MTYKDEFVSDVGKGVGERTRAGEHPSTGLHGVGSHGCKVATGLGEQRVSGAVFAVPGRSGEEGEQGVGRKLVGL